MPEITRLKNKYSGSVTRIHSRGPGGGFIASLAEDVGGALIRVVARYDVAHEQPEIGDAIVVEGVPEDHPTYGLQFRASTFSRVRPTGAAAVNLLARHPEFAFIGARRAASIGRQLKRGAKLEGWEPEVTSLTKARIPVDLIAKCLAVWTAYVQQLELAALVPRLGVATDAVQRLGKLWADPASHILANPYCLAGIADWPRIEQAGIEATAAGAEHPARLPAACVEVFFRRGRRQWWVMPREAHKRALERLLGSSSLAGQAQEAGLRQNALHAFRGDLVQDPGAAAITSALLAAVRKPSGALQLARVQLIVLDGLCASEGLRQVAALHPNALHIVPSAAPPGFAYPHVSVAQATRGIAEEHKEAALATVVIHLSDALEPHVLNLLLNGNVVAETVAIVLTGHSGSHDFADSAFVPMVASKSFRTTYLTLPSEERVHAEAVPTHADVCPQGVTVSRINASNWLEAKDEALGAYREATELRLHRTVIICEKEAVCRIINQELHNEFVEAKRQAKTDGKWDSGSRIGRQHDVLPGEPLRTLVTDLQRGLVRGCLVATAGPSEARSLDLAYACTVQTGSLLCVQTVVIIDLHGRSPGAWNRVYALAECCVVVISASDVSSPKRHKRGANPFNHGDDSSFFQLVIERLQTASKDAQDSASHNHQQQDAAGAAADVSGRSV
jgi:hypothetical protein